MTHVKCGSEHEKLQKIRFIFAAHLSYFHIWDETECRLNLIQAPNSAYVKILCYIVQNEWSINALFFMFFCRFKSTAMVIVCIGN